MTVLRFPHPPGGAGFRVSGKGKRREVDQTNLTWFVDWAVLKHRQQPANPDVGDLTQTSELLLLIALWKVITLEQRIKATVIVEAVHARRPCAASTGALAFTRNLD